MIETGLGGKVVVVTGAAAGIGKATALRFAAEGARVVLWDLSSETGEAAVGEIVTAGGAARFDRVDVSKEAEVGAAVERVIGEEGRVDVLVNNAGITRDSQLAKWKDGSLVGSMPLIDFDAVLAVNLRGVFLPTRAVVPGMIEQGGGVILSASSVVGLYGNFGQTNYSATKAGVIAMTRTWARELGRYKIRVNAVAPGYIATEMVEKMPQKVIDGIAGKTPLGRLGHVDEVAAAYLWLASDAASFVSGTVLSVDGGLVIGT